MKTITVNNNKGGTGKTTTAVNLAEALALKGAKVLLIDTDPQCNASTCYKVDQFIEDNIGKVLLKKGKLLDIALNVGKIDLVPASRELTATEKILISSTNREFLLRKAIERENLSEHYHYIVIDTPPSLGILTENAFCASNEFLVPLECQFFSSEGLKNLLQFAMDIKEELNPELDILGILLTKFHENTTAKIVKKIAESVKNSPVGAKVFKTYIRKTDALMEAQMAGQSIFEYAPDSNGAIDYENLTNEILKIHGKEKKSTKKEKQR